MTISLFILIPLILAHMLALLFGMLIGVKIDAWFQRREKAKSEIRYNAFKLSGALKELTDLQQHLGVQYNSSGQFEKIKKGKTK